MRAVSIARRQQQHSWLFLRGDGHQKVDKSEFQFVLVVVSPAACRQLEFGVQAIFGPFEPLLGGHIQSICEALDIPHIEARVEYESFKEFSINLHPSQQHINSAYKDLMSFLNWTKVAIIYEEDFGELRSLTGWFNEWTAYLLASFASLCRSLQATGVYAVHGQRGL